MTKHINIIHILNIIGIFLLMESIFMLVAAIVALIYGENDLMAILASSGITASVGGITWLLTRQHNKVLRIREGYFIVATVWIIFSFFGMLPFILSGYIPHPIDAYFETISGFTTTGASILNNIEEFPHGLLFWRSLIQWLGGMGIIVLTLAVLPSMGAGIRLFAAEVPGVTVDRIQPRIRETAQRLWGLYFAITAIEVIALWIAGMNFYDSICHALTTMATGGYSTKQASIGHWDIPAIHYIISFFMLVAGTNFTLIYFLVAKRDFKRLFNDQEFKFYMGIVASATALTVIVLGVSNGTGLSKDLELHFREALFQVSSIISTTGYATADFTSWPQIIVLTMLIIMLTGAMAGSTSGGMKLIRVLAVFKNLYYEFKRLIHPRAIIPTRINKHTIPSSIMNNIQAFVTIYFVLLAFGVFILTLDGMPIDESFGAALTSVSNVGPGLGAQGPASNFADLSFFAKAFMSFLMVVGRLEIFTVMLVLVPIFWKK